MPLISATRQRRWSEAQERGDRYACPHCWNGQPEPGVCQLCHRALVHYVPPTQPVSTKLPAQPKGPRLTLPQAAYVMEQRLRKAAGLVALEAKTGAQQAINDGHMPHGPGGALQCD